MPRVMVKMAFSLHRLMVFGNRQTAFWGSYKRNEIVFLPPSRRKTCTGSRNLKQTNTFCLMCSNIDMHRLGLKISTGSWFLVPLAQVCFNLDVRVSGESCANSWILHLTAQRYRLMIGPGSDKSLHMHMVFASAS